jgi:hypothetical protein
MSSGKGIGIYAPTPPDLNLDMGGDQPELVGKTGGDMDGQSHPRQTDLVLNLPRRGYR